MGEKSDVGDSGEHVLGVHYVREALGRALRRLPSEQRDVVASRLLEERAFAEVAQRLGIEEAAARMRFSRAIATVRTALEEEGVGP